MKFLQIAGFAIVEDDEADRVLFRERLADGFVFVAEPSDFFELTEKIELFAGGDDGGVIDSGPMRGGQELEFVKKIRAPASGRVVSCNIIRQ